MQIFIVAINMLHAVSALRRIRQIGSYDGFVVFRLIEIISTDWFEYALCSLCTEKDATYNLIYFQDFKSTDQYVHVICQDSLNDEI